MAKKNIVEKTEKINKKDNLKVLSFRRLMETTDGVMKAVNSKTLEESPIINSFHGQRVPAGYDKDGAKAESRGKKDSSRNLMSGWRAKLPVDSDVLKVSYSVTIFPLTTVPDACDNASFYVDLIKALEVMKNEDEVAKVARYYAYNIANASWMWRNRDSASSIEVGIKYTLSKSDKPTVLIISDALDLALRPVVSKTAKENGLADPSDSYHEIDDLANAIENVLRGKAKPLSLFVEGYAKMTPGREVWPSQLYLPKRFLSDVGKTFFTFGNPVHSKSLVGNEPGITMEKIGNALRTFDNSHNDPNLVIAIETNGGYLPIGLDMRSSSKKNRIYDILQKYVEGIIPLNSDEKVYLIGCIIRGGLFAKSDDKEKEPVSLADMADDNDFEE